MKPNSELILSAYASENREDASIGSVDELGFYALIEVGPVTEQAEVLGIEPGESTDWLVPGWYILREDSDGNTFVLPYDDKDAALAEWTAVEANYALYDGLAKA